MAILMGYGLWERFFAWLKWLAWNLHEGPVSGGSQTLPKAPFPRDCVGFRDVPSDVCMEQVVSLGRMCPESGQTFGWLP